MNIYVNKVGFLSVSKSYKVNGNTKFYYFKNTKSCILNRTLSSCACLLGGFELIVTTCIDNFVYCIQLGVIHFVWIFIRHMCFRFAY